MSMYERFKLKIEKGARVFFDTCVLIHNLEGIKNFLDAVHDSISKESPQIIITLQVKRELEKKALQPETTEYARSALDFIESCVKRRWVKVKGEESDGIFNDRVFLYVFSKFVYKHHLILFTNDKDLSIDCLDINEQRSTLRRKGSVEVYKFSSSGLIIPFKRQVTSNTNTENSGNFNAKEHLKSFKFPGRVFPIATDVISGFEGMSDVSKIPGQGDCVFLENGKTFVLGKELGRGGEGCVYELLDDDKVAKIYFQGKVTNLLKEKISRMISSKLCILGVCWPEMWVLNDLNQRVGYVMPKARGCPLATSVFQPQLLKSKFPSWTKKDLVKLAITIFEKINQLHRKNVILGDINENNMLVVSPEEVYFVDADSYQIEGFPCPVGTQLFCAPEILAKNREYKKRYGKERKFSSFLRTKQEEYFAIATLLFRILVPGKPPYSQTGEENITNNIMEMNFPYQCGEHNACGVPLGKWRFIWSHLSRKLKEAFYGTFKKGEVYSFPNKRLDAQGWLNLLKNYLYALENGYLREVDPMSEDLFPSRFKRQQGVSYADCSNCGKEFPREKSINGLCPECFHSRRIKVVKTVVCSKCGSEFGISQGEVDFFQKMGYLLPKRCPTCRTLRKNI